MIKANEEITSDGVSPATEQASLVSSQDVESIDWDARARVGKFMREHGLSMGDKVDAGTVQDMLVEYAAASLAWEPIATARMDGRRLIVHNGSWTAIGRWDRDPIDEHGQCWRDDDGERIEPPPILWMPLPEPQASEPARSKNLV